jgi:N-acetylmuramoyl-L-alanine amidase
MKDFTPAWVIIKRMRRNQNMKIITKLMTKNDCYKAGKKITPKGILFHSTATLGAMANIRYKIWNKPGVSKAAHFFVDDKSIYQYLPCEKGNIMRAWHSGSGPKGSVNNTHIGIEMCEPKDLKDKTYFEKAYGNMLDLCTYLCKEFG